MESINEKIKRIRIEIGINQADVARSAGIKQSSYASIEKGDTKSISIEVGKGIAKALKIPFNELFDVENVDAGDSLKEEIKLLRKKIDELEEQLNDKRRLVEFLSKNNLLLAVASKLYHDENPIQKKRDFNNLDSLIKEIKELPYDPGEPESQFRYILKRIDEMKNDNKE